MSATRSATLEPSRTTALLQALIVTVLWSSSWVIIRFVLDRENLAPLTFAGLRYVVGAVVLWAVALGSARSRGRLVVGRRALFRLVLLGVVMYSLTQGAQFVALDRQPAATTSLLLSATPLVVAILAGAILRERPTRAQVMGALLVAMGAGLYFGGALGATGVGLAAALVGLLANAVASMMGRAENRRVETTPLTTTVLSMSVGAVLLLGVGIAVEGSPTITARAAIAIAWLGIVNTAFAFTLWNHTLQHLSATESAVVNNTMLIQIAILAWIFLGEAPDPIQLAGIGVVTTGVFGATLRRGEPTRTGAYRLAPLDADSGEVGQELGLAGAVVAGPTATPDDAAAHGRGDRVDDQHHPDGEGQDSPHCPEVVEGELTDELGADPTRSDHAQNS